VTADVGSRLVRGTAPDVLLARLARVVGAATAAPGISSVGILVDGGRPLGLFPGIDARRALMVDLTRVPTLS
jgi:hypothetical protein